MLLGAAPASAAVTYRTTVLAGTGTAGFAGDGGQAKNAQIAGPIGIDRAADGSIYFADQFNQRIRRIAPDGVITTVAGNGVQGFGGDGGAATSASFSAPSDVAVLPNGQILVSDANNNRIRRFTVGGTITTVVGTGAASFSGDGGPATSATISFPYGIAVYPDGSYLFADSDNNRIRKVTAGGTISTVAGNGPRAYGGDGGQAVSAYLAQPMDVERYNDEGYLIADAQNHRIRRVLPSGVISTFIGTGSAGNGPEGLLGPATALNGPVHVARTYNGHVYVADHFNHKIRYKPSGGVVETFAGALNGAAGSGGLNGPATGVQLNDPFGVYVMPAEPGPEDVLIADTQNARILRVSLADEGTTPPGVTLKPALSGLPKPGQTLTCIPGQYEGITAPAPGGGGSGNSQSFAWELAARDASDDDDAAWKAIVGDVGSTHLVREVEAGWRIRCRETLVGTAGTVSAAAKSLRVDRDVPVLRAGSAPSIGGIAQTGGAVTCGLGDWDNAGSFETQWLIDGKVVYTTGSGSPYGVPAGSAGGRITCRVIGTNDLGSSSPAPSTDQLIINDVPRPTNRRPQIGAYSTGSRPTDRRMDCWEGQWYDVDGPYAFRWFRGDGTLIDGETGQSYMARVDDLGQTVSCEVTASNRLGPSAPVRSKPALVPLPTTGSEGRLFTAIHGLNYNAPTSLLPVSAEQLALMDSIIDRRYAELMAITRAGCAKITAAPATFGNLTGRTLSDAETCWLLASGQPTVRMSDGVFWSVGGCYPLRSASVPLMATLRNVTSFRGIVDFSPPRDYYGVPLCPQLNIAVPTLDRSRAREVDPEVASAFAAASPIKILWDLNGDGRTEATCGPDGPVMRTIPERGKYPNLRAVLVYPDSERTGVYGIAANNFDFSFGKDVQGTLRGGQVFACRTQMDIPPEPDLPCVKSATIGRVSVTGNLCPVLTRNIPPGELDALPPDLQTALRAQGLVEGAKATRAARNRFLGGLVGSGSPPPLAELMQATGNQDKLWSFAGGVLAASRPTNLTTGAAKRADSKDVLQALPGTKLSPRDLVDLPGWFKPEASSFATDQIYISKGAIKVNGVTVDPGSATQSLLDGTVAFVPSEVKEAVSSVRSMTVSSSDAALSMLSQKGILPLTDAEKFKTELQDDAKAQAQQFVNQNLDQLKKSLKDKLDIGPFKLAGEIDVKLESDQTASIHASASLPIFTDLEGRSLLAEIKATADKDGRIQLQTIHINVPSALLGPIEVRNLDIVYDGGLSVTGQIIFGPGGSGIDITRFRLANGGQFEALGLKYNAGAGQGIPIGPGVFMTQIGGEFDLPGLDFKQGRIKAYAAIGAGQSVGRGCPAAGLKGDVDLNWTREQFALDAHAEPIIACVSFGQVNFHADTNGYFRIWGDGGIKLGPLSVTAALNAQFQLAREFSNSRFQVFMQGNGSIAGVLDGTVKAMVSNKGVAGCGSITVVKVPLIDELFGETIKVTIAGGAGIRFVGGLPPVTPVQLISGIRVFVGCDLSDWGVFSAVHTIAGKRAQAVRAIPIEGGQKLVALSVAGVGGVPRFTLKTPDGRALDYTNVPEQLTAMPNGSSAVAVPAESRTVILLAEPLKGTYTLEAAPGSVAIGAIKTAAKLPDPKIKVRVQGKGAKRTLRYDIERIPGQSVRFVEQAEGASREIGIVRTGGQGTKTWTVAEAKRNGGRTIVAEVIQDDLPRTQLSVAKFSAPNQPIAKVRGLKVKRGKKALTVRWQKASGAVTYIVRVTRDGRRETYRPDAGKSSLTIAGISRGGRVKVRVTAVSAAGRRGPGVDLTSRR